VSMGWSKGANTRALLTSTLNMERANSPKTGHRHTVQKPPNSIIVNHESLRKHKIGVWIFSRLLYGMESENWHLGGHSVRTFCIRI
jgi:hypothetical protein